MCVVPRLNPLCGGWGNGDWPDIAVEAATLEDSEVGPVLVVAVVW